MSLKKEIEQIIRDTVPGCIAIHDRDGHDRDGHDKLHPADIAALAKAIAAHIKSKK
jgi:hypothetical protein